MEHALRPCRPHWRRRASTLAIACVIDWLTGEGAFADTRAVDPLLPSGLVIATTGVGFGVAGATLASLAEGPNDGRGASGASLIGAAVGTGFVGMAASVAGTVGDVPQPGLRKSETRMVAGLSLTALGSGTAGAGVGLLASGDPNVVGVAIPLLVGSSAVLGIGLPLLWTGAREPGSAERSEEAAMRDPRTPKTIRSQGMRAAGMVLTFVGIGAMAAAAVAVASGENGLDRGYRALFVGAPLGGAGVISMAVGIPLWAVGSREVSVQQASAPSLRVSPSSIALSYAF